jgi:hypothetical protein
MMSATETITIDRRFCGPDGMGNGGYGCGVLAAGIDGPAEITLKAPLPLDKPITLTRGPNGTRLADGDVEIGVARPASLELDVPEAPSFGEAQQAMEGQVPEDVHLAPHCFVCGPKRKAGDGMRILAGPLENRGRMAAAGWIIDESLVDADGLAKPEYIYGALDCPGYIAVGKADQMALLGRMTAEILARPKRGERCIAAGWPIEQEGRKFHVGTAVYAEDGTVLARALSTWIALKA